MSLQLRLVASTVLALLLSFCLSGGLAVVRASHSVRIELGAAMEVGTQTIGNGVADLATITDPSRGAARLVATFDGNRHLRAVLVDRAGAVVSQSSPMLSDPPVPGWFLGLVGPKVTQVRTALPEAAGGGAILLQPEPANEVGEVWSSLGDTRIELGLFCLSSSALIFWIASRALRPLERLGVAHGQIGAADYDVRVPVRGPPELARLALALNRMAGQLAATTGQNRRLHEQLLTLQDEERAELARDLHDEIGPFLFSISIAAATIDRLVASGETAQIPGQLAAIREAVGYMQKEVRSILARLRPTQAIEFGLELAVANLVAFWKDRRPSITFEVATGPGAAELGEVGEEVAYRIVQESLSNAVRHGNPSRIGIDVRNAGPGVAIVVTDDGSRGEVPAAAGLGLAGMRERVSGLGGTLLAGWRHRQRGWEVAALLPRLAAADGDPLLPTP